MGRTVDVTIPVEPEAAERLAQPGERERIGQMVSRMLVPRREAWAEELMQAIADLKAEARAAGLTDEMIDAELEAYNAERRGEGRPD